jgi:hypothetical protein
MLQGEREMTACAVKDIAKSLQFIISHFVGQHLWPRLVSGGNMWKYVYSDIEALHIFEQAEFKDCRINAYPPMPNRSGRSGRWGDYLQQQQRSPSSLLFDVDRSIYLQTILQRIEEIIGGVPTVIETSPGHYHILQPLQAIPLEGVLTSVNEPSNTFLKYSEHYLGDGLTCQGHHPSFDSCMLRIPGSVRKDGFQVSVASEWDKKLPSIVPLLLPYTNHLASAVAFTKQKSRVSSRTTSSSRGLGEKLLQTPIKFRRGIAIRSILAPYLITVRELPLEESRDKIMEWLERCSMLRPTKIDKSYVTAQLRYSRRIGLIPISLPNLKAYDICLYNLMK